MDRDQIAGSKPCANVKVDVDPHIASNSTILISVLFISLFQLRSGLHNRHITFWLPATSMVLVLLLQDPASPKPADHHAGAEFAYREDSHSSSLWHMVKIQDAR